MGSGGRTTLGSVGGGDGAGRRAVAGDEHVAVTRLQNPGFPRNPLSAVNFLSYRHLPDLSESRRRATPKSRRCHE